MEWSSSSSGSCRLVRKQFEFLWSFAKIYANQYRKYRIALKKKCFRLYHKNHKILLKLLFSDFGLYAFAMNFDVDLSGWSELRVVEEPIQDSGSMV